MMETMPEVVIVDALRTPIGLRHGQLSGWHPVDLTAALLDALIRRNQLDPSQVEEVVLGCVSQAGNQSLNVGRNAVLAAGWAESVPGTTIDRQQASSLQAVSFVVRGVRAGLVEIGVAGGIESTSTTPVGVTMVAGSLPFGPQVLARYAPLGGLSPEGVAAERLAEEVGLLRRQLDTWALRSHAAAIEAKRRGWCHADVLAVAARRRDKETGTVVEAAEPLGADEGPDPSVTAGSLAAMKPLFERRGRITAGNLAPLGDGAAAVLIMSASAAAAAAALGRTPRARVVAMASAAGNPRCPLSLLGPATARVLEQARLGLSDIDAFEVDESFAAGVLAWAQETQPDMSLVNAHGGSVALGHAPGAAGIRQLVTLLQRLDASGGRYGLAVCSAAGGMADAIVIQRLDAGDAPRPRQTPRRAQKTDSGPRR